MKNIKAKLDTLKSSISKMDDDKNKEIFNMISEIIDGLYIKVDEIIVNETVLAENFKYMNEDISGIQEELFEEVSLEDLDEMEEDYQEISCIHCGKPLFIEESVIYGDEEIKCPYCNKNIKE